MNTTKDQIVERYQTKLDEQNEIVRSCSARWSTVGYIRGITFLLTFAPIILAISNVFGLGATWFYLCPIIFLIFLVIAFFHEGMQTNMRRSSMLAEMNRESLARLRREWPKIKVPKIEVPRKYEALTFDLDLKGPSSLYKLLGTCRTPLGIETLRNWLIYPALPEEVVARQEAVKELSQDADYRERFRLLCEQLSASQSGPSGFVGWCESSDWYKGRTWILWFARLSSLFFVVTILLMVFQVISLFVAGVALLSAIALNFLMSVLFAGQMHEMFNQISSRANDIMHYESLFKMVSKFKAESPRLVEIQNRLADPKHAVLKNVNSLGRLVWLANMRRNGILFIGYLILEFIFFWDAHILQLLENWKRSHGDKAAGWFADLGQWETLLALSKLAADHPDWVYPTVETGAKMSPARISAKQLGHPLLDDRRVCNDVTVGPAGSVLLVTGSNMSGKSTLLRSLGVNVVLAQMGTVVCADEMSLPSLRIETSMRIVDSLADGVSFFMAELKRLKEIVDTAGEIDGDKEWSMLFLLDEILQGTNSQERQIAVSRVVRRLIDGNAIGCISTHDLDLGQTKDLTDKCNTVHFAESFERKDGQEVMTFDYRMREGISPTTNALKLLEMVGLGEKK